MPRSSWDSSRDTSPTRPNDFYPRYLEKDRWPPGPADTGDRGASAASTIPGYQSHKDRGDSAVQFQNGRQVDITSNQSDSRPSNSSRKVQDSDAESTSNMQPQWQTIQASNQAIVHAVNNLTQVFMQQMSSQPLAVPDTLRGQVASGIYQPRDVTGQAQGQPHEDGRSRMATNVLQANGSTWDRRADRREYSFEDTDSSPVRWHVVPRGTTA